MMRLPNCCLVLFVVHLVIGCGSLPPGVAPAPTCGGLPLYVSFYDVGQGLSALVQLPDGRTILVDAGDIASRTSKTAQARLIDRLSADLPNKSIDVLWVTHPHSDHIGGARAVLTNFDVATYVDNGRDWDVPMVQATIATAALRGTKVVHITPDAHIAPMLDGNNVYFTAQVPSAWSPRCAQNRNLCSIVLRIDYCASSILFAGDAEAEEERAIIPQEQVSLLQVGHHGSDTSSSMPFLHQLRPAYAVISSGKPGEGTNRSYCHPRASTVRTLAEVLDSELTSTLKAFEGTAPCGQSTRDDWVDVPVPATLWATSRDGDVVLVTSGDGRFRRLSEAR